MRDNILDGIMGLCVADAVGVPVEFKSRESLKSNPVTNMLGHGTYNQLPGTWSDDSSMTLCLLDSLSGGLDYRDIMAKFLSWLKDAKYTPYNEVFDVGNATRNAIQKFESGEEPLLCGGTKTFDNGNGSLMRILPAAFYLYTLYEDNITNNENAMLIIHNISSLTHAHKCSLIACGIYVDVACILIDGLQLPEAINLGILNAIKYYSQHVEYSAEITKYNRLFQENFKDLPEESIKSTGYVVDTLEAAFWCLLNTHSYEECVLKAVNLGDDSDTVAAVAGGLAGIYYGYKAIPEQWISQLARKDYIQKLCNNLTFSLNANCARCLFEYIPFFEEISNNYELILWCRDYSIYVPVTEHLDIDYKIGEFCAKVYNSGITTGEYSNIIRNYGLNDRKVDELSDDIVSNADLLLTRAMLTWHFRRDNFNEGSLIRDSIAGGKILKLLLRMQEIIENK